MKKIEVTEFRWIFTGAQVEEYSKRLCVSRPSFRWAKVAIERPGRLGELRFNFRHAVPRFEPGREHFLSLVGMVGGTNPFFWDSDHPLQICDENPWVTATYYFKLRKPGNDIDQVMELFRNTLYLRLGVVPGEGGWPAVAITQRTDVMIKGFRIPFGTFKSAQFHPVVCPLYPERHPVGDEADRRCLLCGGEFVRIPIGGDRGDEWSHPFRPTFKL